MATDYDMSASAGRPPTGMKASRGRPAGISPKPMSASWNMLTTALRRTCSAARLVANAEPAGLQLQRRQGPHGNGFGSDPVGAGRPARHRAARLRPDPGLRRHPTTRCQAGLRNEAARQRDRAADAGVGQAAARGAAGDHGLGPRGHAPEPWRPSTPSSGGPVALTKARFGLTDTKIAKLRAACYGLGSTRRRCNLRPGLIVPWRGVVFPEWTHGPVLQRADDLAGRSQDHRHVAPGDERASRT
ncbi:hypothetical protein ACRAWD_18070 [Caulobacter segnis]